MPTERIQLPFDDETIDKMQIWSKYRNTPKEKTKKVTFGRGFTSIHPQYQLECATKLWGPCGDRWGVDVTSTQFVPVDGKTVVWMQAQLFYPSIYDSRRVAIDQVIDQVLKPNDDVAKKMLTSLRSKGLSCLGFGSDVFEGLYENEQYLQDERIRDNPESFVQEAIAGVQAASSEAALHRCKDRAATMHKHGTISEEAYRQILDAIHLQAKAINAK